MLSSALSVNTKLVLTDGGDTLTITDITDYVTEGVDTATVTGILKVTTPSGVSYENAGFATDDFSSPDIDVDVDTEITSIPIFAGDDGEPAPGTYTISYKAYTTAGGGEMFEKDFTFVYDATRITVVPSAETDTFRSLLTSTDSTDWALTINSVEYTPDTVVYSHSIDQPAGAGGTNPGTSALKTRIIGPSIYTGDWTIDITATATYEVDTEFTVEMVVNTEITHSVVDVGITTTMLEGMNTLQTALLDARSDGQKYQQQVIEAAMVDLSTNYTLYWIAITTGADPGQYTENIQDILFTNDVIAEPSDTPVEIVPAYGVIGGTTVYFVTAIPDNATGNDGDMAINTTSSPTEMYGKAAGVWALKVSIGGAGAGAVANPMTATLDADSNKITNLPTPSAAGEAVPLGYYTQGPKCTYDHTGVVTGLDVNDGYSVGSQVVRTDTATNELWICVDNTAGSPLWLQVPSAAWGAITGTLSDQPDLYAALAAILGIPTGGSTDQLLAKNSATDGDGKWVTPPTPIPSGGAAGQGLMKASATDYDYAWGDVGAPIRTVLATASIKNADDTIAADTGFTTAVAANGIYRLEVYLSIDTSSAADFKIKLEDSLASELTGSFQINDGLGWTTKSIGTIVTTASGNGNGIIIMSGILFVGSTGCDLELWWAQGTSTVYDTTINAGSFIELTKLN